MLAIGSIFKSVVNFVLDKDNQRFILLILFAITLIGAIQYRDKFKDQVQETQKQINNIEALNDSVTTYRNKAGELTSQKSALQSDKEQLKTLNKDLYDELEKEKGNVEYLSNVVTRLRRDSIGVDTTIIVEVDPDTWKLDWKKEEAGENWSQLIKGYTQFTVDTSGVPYNANTMIVEQTLNMKITTGIKEEDGKRTIFIRSSYPYINFTDIDGAILGPVKSVTNNKSSRWGIGISGGYGYTLGNDNFSPYIGVGLTYDIIQF